MADEASYLFESVVRGHHVYKRLWSPAIGEVLQLTPEETNEHDRFAACLVKGDVVVGLVPRELLRTIWHFLRHVERESYLCGVVGRRQLGKGLEVPCVYRFVGKQCLVQRLEGLLKRTRQPHVDFIDCPI